MVVGAGAALIRSWGNCTEESPPPSDNTCNDK